MEKKYINIYLNMQKIFGKNIKKIENLIDYHLQKDMR